MLTLLETGNDSWLTLVLVALAAVLVALIAHAVLFALARRASQFSMVARVLVDYVRQPARLLLAALALQVVLQLAFESVTGPPPAYHTAVLHAVALLLIAAVTWVSVGAVSGAKEAIVRLHPVDVADNLEARRVQTQTRVVARMVVFLLVLLGTASALMIFPAMRQVGTSLLASAGVVALAAGIAARPVLGNLIAGLQIALTQPIRLDDVVIIEGEWARVEEITSTYVVVKIWDERRLIVPLQWIIENPFQNWTRKTAQILGTVFLWVDYSVPLAPLRAELKRVCEEAPEWDGRVAIVQVVETSERAIQLRALVSSPDASKAWDLRCRVREALITFLLREYPEALPRVRAEIHDAQEPSVAARSAMPPERAGLGDSSAIKPSPSDVPAAPTSG
jgi:small-conductance mechanosensitive channel